MKKIALIALASIWIACLIILIAALTDLFPHNIFMDNRIVVVIGFLAISGFIGRAFRKLLKTE